MWGTRSLYYALGKDFEPVPWSFEKLQLLFIACMQSASTGTVLAGLGGVCTFLPFPTCVYQSGEKNHNQLRNFL